MRKQTLYRTATDRKRPLLPVGCSTSGDLDKEFPGRYTIALGHTDGLRRTADWRLDLGFHLHRFADQHRLPSLDHVTFFDQHIDHIARHAGADVARCAGLLALAAALTHEVVQRLEDNLFRHTIDGKEEVTFAIALDANARDIHAVAFPMHVDDELGRHTIIGRRTHAGAIRNRQQGYRAQGSSGAFLEELAADIREHRIGQHVFLALRQLTDLATQTLHFRPEQVGRAAEDD